MKQVTREDVGVWIDGSLQNPEQGSRRVIEAAMLRGFSPSVHAVMELLRFPDEIEAAYPEGLRKAAADVAVRYGEILGFLQDEAISYLNECAPDGFWLGWLDGDFGLWHENEE